MFFPEKPLQIKFSVKDCEANCAILRNVHECLKRININSECKICFKIFQFQLLMHITLWKVKDWTTFKSTKQNRQEEIIVKWFQAFIASY